MPKIIIILLLSFLAVAGSKPEKSITVARGGKIFVYGVIDSASYDSSEISADLAKKAIHESVSWADTSFAFADWLGLRIIIQPREIATEVCRLPNGNKVIKTKTPKALSKKKKIAKSFFSSIPITLFFSFIFGLMWAREEKEKKNAMILALIASSFFCGLLRLLTIISSFNSLQFKGSDVSISALIYAGIAFLLTFISFLVNFIIKKTRHNRFKKYQRAKRFFSLRPFIISSLLFLI